jgi:hypothetical protein|tara:strand:- start:281 stop:961 length:681 start_codon:yes stop_codon:yes gene_type:complete
MNMNFIAYEKVDSFIPDGIYNLQLNPDKFDITYDGDKKSEEDAKLADGQMVESSEPLFGLQKWHVEFLIDNTGALPYPPMSIKPPIVLPGFSIRGSIDYFKKLFVEADDEIHSRKYIKGIWGRGEINIFGRVKGFKYNYSFWSTNGTPLRAKCILDIEEVPLGNSSFMSPDITRIPQVKQSDTLINFCQKYYNDKNYYLEVAKHNNLSSFRKLKNGSNLEFPPIKK